MPIEPGEPLVTGEPNVPLTAGLRYNLQNTLNTPLGGQVDLGAFLKALMQKLDLDAGVTDTDFESLFTP